MARRRVDAAPCRHETRPSRQSPTATQLNGEGHSALPPRLVVLGGDAVVGRAIGVSEPHGERVWVSAGAEYDDGQDEGHDLSRTIDAGRKQVAVFSEETGLPYAEVALHEHPEDDRARHRGGDPAAEALEVVQHQRGRDHVAHLAHGAAVPLQQPVHRREAAPDEQPDGHDLVPQAAAHAEDFARQRPLDGLAVEHLVEPARPLGVADGVQEDLALRGRVGWAISAIVRESPASPRIDAPCCG